MIWLVALYLVSVVAANVTVSLWQWMAYINSIVFIGLDLTLKDKFQLHLTWWQILSIVSAGGILTFILNASFMSIAIASTVALIGAFSVDALVFQLFKQNIWYRVMLSNIFGAFADSLLFALLAPFSFTWVFVLTMTALKIIGGAISGYILIKKGILR